MVKKLSALIASLGLLLAKVSPVLAASCDLCNNIPFGLGKDECLKNCDISITIPTPSAAVSDLGKLINAGITAAIVIAGLLAFVFLVLGGLQWLTSGGDKSKYEAARDRITAAIIGLAIVAVSVAVIKIVGQFFGLDIFNIKFPTAVGPAVP